MVMCKHVQTLALLFSLSVRTKLNTAPVVQLTRIRRVATLIAAYDLPAALCALLYSIFVREGATAIFSAPPSYAFLLVLIMQWCYRCCRGWESPRYLLRSSFLDSLGSFTSGLAGFTPVTAISFSLHASSVACTEQCFGKQPGSACAHFSLVCLLDVTRNRMCAGRTFRDVAVVVFECLCLLSCVQHTICVRLLSLLFFSGSQRSDQ